MQHVTPAARGLRILLELGSDRFWVAGAVILGLFLASWVGNTALETLIAPIHPEGIGY